MSEKQTTRQSATYSALRGASQQNVAHPPAGAMERSPAPAIQDLSPEHKALVSKVAAVFAATLNEYADMMERGELEMMPGPQALRWVAGAINLVLIQQEDQHGK